MNSRKNVNSFPVLLLAGRRTGFDPICSAYNTVYKALAPVAGEPMIVHVLRNLEACEYVSEIIVLAQEPDILKQGIGRFASGKKIRFSESNSGIARTVLTVWDKFNLKLPMLVTTADNCLLRGEHLDDFLFKALNTASEMAVGFAEKENVVTRYPETRRTWINFQDTSITGCNLFLFSDESSMDVVRYWNNFESSPKKFIKLAWSLGPVFFTRYLLRKITVIETFEIISRLLGARVNPVFLDNPDIAIDADKMTDIRQIEAILGKQTSTSTAAESCQSETKPVVIFDLDRTITTFGTYTPFLIYFALYNNPFRLISVPVIILFMILYKLKCLNRKQLKTIMFALLAGKPKDEVLNRACNAYVDRVLDKHVNLDALFTIRDWRKNGAKLVLATASYDWLAGVFARRLNFDHVVSTRSIRKDDRVLPGIMGENCYGQGKLDMLDAEVGPLDKLRESGHEIWFYTDHHSDIPLLELCTHPVAVNATATLEKWADNFPAARLLNWQTSTRSVIRKRFIEAISDTY